ncbi:MAG: CHAT domain-containing protein, partial [Cyanobacteria bacterium J06642_11]
MNTFEITIQRKAGNYYPIVSEYNRPGILLPIRAQGKLRLTPEDISELISLGRPKDYGIRLGELLFQGYIGFSFAAARSRSEERLRVLLFIEADDPDLKSLRWERLCAPMDGGWNFLSRDQRVPFSLYIPSITDRRFPPIGQRDLRALMLVASPENSSRFKLAHFDVNKTVASVRTALGKTIPCDVLAHDVEGAIGLPTLENLCEQLTKQSYTILHFVSHGRLIDQKETVLYWTDEENQVEVVKGSDLIEELKNIRGPKGLPHFAFLCTCESASKSADGAFGGFAEQLVRDLGMPAVVAMTEKVTIKTAESLVKRFYEQLRKHGEVDLALDEATAGLGRRRDVIVPALFSRLGGRPLFSDTLNRPLTSLEIETGLDEFETLLQTRAPVLFATFMTQKEKLTRTLMAEVSDLSASALQERQKALDAINTLAGEVLDISFNALALEPQKVPEYDQRCPFRGLYPFRLEDQAFFFGREELIQILHDRLKDDPFLAILGASGSGKSSLLLAGLLPVLQKDEPGLEPAYMTPTHSPLEQLETTLENFKTQSFVLIVDQFEELFTLCTDKTQKQGFIDRLLDLVKQDQKIIVTMRADFWGECAAHEDLRALMQQRQELIAPMNSLELRGAMEQQAGKIGLRFEAGLSNTILDAVQDEPGAMPLLQHALLELWKTRHGRWLRYDEYKKFGGIEKALAKTADDIYNDFSDGEKQLVQNIFVRLTRLDSGTTPRETIRDTRQRVVLEDLVPATDDLEKTRTLVRHLAGEGVRLLVISVNQKTQETEVEVAHEALIRYWPKLQAWLNRDRDRLLLRNSIKQAAEVWHGQELEDDLVHRGGRLEDAEDLLAVPGFLNDLEADYVSRCVELRDRTIREKEARNITFVVNDLLSRDKNPTQALRLAQVAYRLDTTHKLSNVSHLFSLAYHSAANSRSAFYLANLKHTDVVNTAIYSPDGQKILTVSKDATAKLWDNQGQLLQVIEHPEPIQNAAFSHDGSKLVTVGYDHLVKMWDGDGNYLKDLIGHQSYPYNNVNSVAFSPDDQTIVTVSSDTQVIVWDAMGNKKQELHDHWKPIGYVTFSPDGKYFVTCGLWEDSTAKLYDHDGNLIESLAGDMGAAKKEHGWQQGITFAAFSPDSQ